MGSWESSTGAWEGQEYDTRHGPGMSKGPGRGRSLGVGGYLNRGMDKPKLNAPSNQMGGSRSLGWDRRLGTEQNHVNGRSRKAAGALE